MSRGRRRSVRVKPAVVDGFKFISASEAFRYEGLKALAGDALTSTVSTDGSMLVCEWYGADGVPRTQAFTLARKGRNKYNARPTEINGIKFASGHEAERYVQLLRLQAAGEIDSLTPHPRTYQFIVNDVSIGRYTPDSEYRIVATNTWVIEDAKSEATRKARDYPLRKKLMLACHGIALAEA